MCPSQRRRLVEVWYHPLRWFGATCRSYSRNATNTTDTPLQGAALRTFCGSDRASPPSRPSSAATPATPAAAAAAAASAPAASGGLGAASIHGTVAPRASTTVTKLVSAPSPHAAQTPAGSEMPALAGTASVSWSSAFVSRVSECVSNAGWLVSQ